LLKNRRDYDSKLKCDYDVQSTLTCMFHVIYTGGTGVWARRYISPWSIAIRRG